MYIIYLMPDITDAKGSDLMRHGLFGGTDYNTDKNLVGYGVGLGTQKYKHEDGKEARNLAILDVSSSDSKNALFLGMRSIKIRTNDKVAVQAKDKLKTNCTIPDKFFFLSVFHNASDDSSESLLNLGSISDNSVLHYSHTLNGNIYYFSVDYETAATGKIQKIHKYLMKKHNIK